MKGWNEFFDGMLVDAVRLYFFQELKRRSLFPITEYVVDLSGHYENLGVPLGKNFSVDIAGISAGFLLGKHLKVEFLIEVESSKNSKLQKENNYRKLGLLAGDLGCACMQVEVPSISDLAVADSHLMVKFSEVFLKGKDINDFCLDTLRDSSLLFLNPPIRLKVLHCSYPKGFRKLALPKERLGWWLGLLAGGSLERLAGRMRAGEMFRGLKKFWEIDDGRFFAELERRDSDFPSFAKGLHAFCLAAGIGEISSFAGFAEFKGKALTSTVIDADEGGKWYRMDDGRLLNVLVAGVRLGLFEGSADIANAEVVRSGVWKVVSSPHGLAGGLNLQAEKTG
jgi:hypothetical protein